MSGPSGNAGLHIAIDRGEAMPLSEQIGAALRAAIRERRIEPGARLPSWRDLAVQLGVARGTVRAAYDRLTDEALLVPCGAAGTRVAETPMEASASAAVTITPPLQRLDPRFCERLLPFQMGVPAQDAFPAKLWARIRTRAVRDDALAPLAYPDPRGLAALRTQIAAYLAIARGIRCVPDQVLVTSGFKNGLSLAIRTLNIQGRAAWMEEPGLPFTRMGLELAGLRPVAVPVDEQGIDVAAGIALAPDAAIAVVTPGQQAPTGVTLAAERRRALLRWAAREDAWVIEDDYLSELQLEGRAAPALAADDPAGRVIHVGSFSKTLSPSLGLGFVVAPLALAERFGEVAGCLAPAPNPTTQLAVAGFFADGHYLRHLRHMKRLYAARRDGLRACLGEAVGVEAMAGLALLLRLPPGSDDVAIAHAALEHGIAPFPVSPWYVDPARRSPGLLLGVTNLREAVVEPACASLKRLLRGAL
ncbi:MAG: PLP-dependent aminotransferase family protein [Acetobacteraceae bacterium]